MFYWLNKCGVESETGFVVQIIGVDLLSYRENGRKIDFYTETYQSGGVLYLDLWRTKLASWESGVKISEPSQEQILNNIRSALKFMEIELLVQDS